MNNFIIYIYFATTFKKNSESQFEEYNYFFKTLCQLML